MGSLNLKSLTHMAKPGKFISVIEQRLLSLISVDRYLPIQIDITNLCNLRCHHCYHPHHSNAGALSLTQWFSVLDQYEDLIARLHFDPCIIICGGEPLLSPMLKPLMARIQSSQLPYKVSILSNGTLAEHYDYGIFEGLSSVSFQISLDGPDAANHNQVRGSGSFEKTMKGIKALQSQGYPVSFLAVLSRRNADMIPQFFDLAKDLGARSMGFTRLIAEGEAKSLVASKRDRALEPLELKEAMIAIVRESARTGISSCPQKPLFRLIHPQLGRSGRFGEGIVIDYRGKILASSRSRLVLGDISKDRIEDVLLGHPILQAIRKGHVEGCGECRFYDRCGGDRNAAYAHSGNYLGRDPGCWIELSDETNRKVKI